MKHWPIKSLFGKSGGPEKDRFVCLSEVSYLVSRFLFTPCVVFGLGLMKKPKRWTAVRSSDPLKWSTSFCRACLVVSPSFDEISSAWCLYSSRASLVNKSEALLLRRSQLSVKDVWKVTPRCGCGGLTAFLMYGGGWFVEMAFSKTEICLVMCVFADVNLLTDSAKNFTNLKSVSESCTRGVGVSPTNSSRTS